MAGFAGFLSALLAAGCVAFALFVGVRAAIAAAARVPGRLPPFGEPPRAGLARRSFILRLALTVAGPLAIYLLGTGLWVIALRGAGVMDQSSTRIDVVPGGPADEAGVRDGDRIVAVGGAPLAGFPALRGMLAHHAGERVDLLVEREGRELHLAVTPGAVGSYARGTIGVKLRPETPAPAAAVRAALRRPLDMLEARVEAAGPRVKADLVGPIEITQQLGPRPSTVSMLMNGMALLVTSSLEVFLLLALFLFPFGGPGGTPDDGDPVPPGRPWLRFVARVIDTTVFCLALEVVLFVINRGAPDVVSATIVFLTIPIEAALLASWGTTPGKALVGLAVRDGAGRKLRFGPALRRAAGVWTFGLAGTQILGIATGILAFRRLRRGRAAYWDALDGFRVEPRDVSPVRIGVAVAIIVVVALWVAGVIVKNNVLRSGL
jgi:hypothetical protein